MEYYHHHLRAWEAAALLTLSLALCLGCWAQGRQERLRGEVVRLHVIAVSDEAEEQALKLRVRDAVLEYLEPELAGIESAAGAREKLAALLPEIRAAALAASEGRSVTVTLGRENYPTRRYESFALPAGSYDSLRVVLGEGKGRNWWCVVFPPLCLSASGAERVQSVMSAEDFALVSEEEGYELRFRILELWGELCARLEK